MNKADLVRQIAEKAGVNLDSADKVISAAIETIMEAVSSGSKVTLLGFGTFEVRDAIRTYLATPHYSLSSTA